MTIYQYIIIEKNNKIKKHNTNNNKEINLSYCNQEQLNNVDNIDKGNKFEKNLKENKVIKHNDNIKNCN